MGSKIFGSGRLRSVLRIVDGPVTGFDTTATEGVLGVRVRGGCRGDASGVVGDNVGEMYPVPASVPGGGPITELRCRDERGGSLSRGSRGFR